MDQNQFFNPSVVHDVAAYLFWMLAEDVGVPEANDSVVNSGGRCLFQIPFANQLLSLYEVEQLDFAQQQHFCNAVAAEATQYALREENMEGIIYADDSISGRSISARNVPTDHLRNIPKAINVADDGRMERVGQLCLRHPLPAVVFSTTRPVSNSVIEVADTSKALGFHLPMFLTNINSKRLESGLFVSSGLLCIPVPDEHMGNHWSSALQNSIRFTNSLTLQGETGAVVVNVTW